VEAFSDVLDFLVEQGLTLNSHHVEDFFTEFEIDGTLHRIKRSRWNVSLSYKGSSLYLASYEQGIIGTVHVRDVFPLLRTIIETLHDIEEEFDQEYLHDNYPLFVKYYRDDFGEESPRPPVKTFLERLKIKKDMKQLLGRPLYERFMHSDMDI